MRRAGRIDGNQARVTALFRALGCVVWVTSGHGKGAPDLVVRTPRGTVLLVELKDPAQPPSKRRLTPDEFIFAAKWGASYVVVTFDSDVVRVAAC